MCSMVIVDIVVEVPMSLFLAFSINTLALRIRLNKRDTQLLFAEQIYGSGIYFSRTPADALKMWNGQKGEFTYIFQAQVLTGKSTIGSPDLILPPAIGSDPLKRYDSLTGKQNTHVIFNGQQALPEYLIICSRPTFLKV